MSFFCSKCSPSFAKESPLMFPRLSVQYRTALIQLLQPMLHLGHMTRDSYAQLQSLVLQHATAGLELLIHYRNMYSNSHISPLQLLCLVQLCDAIVRYDRNRENTSQTMRFCLASLEDAKVGYPVAAPLQKMFRNSLAEYSLRVPDDLEELISQSMNLDQEALLDACTRTTYRQPLSQLLHNVHANTAQEFITRWQHLFARGGLPEERIRAGSVTSGNERRFDIGSLLNP